MLKPQRLFHNHYICEECPNEWDEYLLTKGESWCPCCDAECEPYASDELFEEFADEEAE